MGDRGGGVATRKLDGTSCMIRDGVLYKRYDVKTGKPVPSGAIPCETEPNEHTGHWPHWLLVNDGVAEDRWHNEAIENHRKVPAAAEGSWPLPDGTYELCGPKINGNPDDIRTHVLLPHGKQIFEDCPRTFGGLREFIAAQKIEGVVFHHPDGRMVKIKAKDFGLPWGRSKSK